MLIGKNIFFQRYRKGLTSTKKGQKMKGKKGKIKKNKTCSDKIFRKIPTYIR